MLAVALRDVQRRHGFARLPPKDRADIDRAIGELERAGALWRSGVLTSGQERSDPVPAPGVGQVGFRAPPALVTIGEVAETLGVSVSTVRRMVGNGASGLPALRVGGRSIRFRRSDVDELLKGRGHGSK